jgi:WD40 repeat protein
MPGTSGAKDCSFSAPENLCCCAYGRSFICFDARQPSVAIQAHAIDNVISAISCSNDGRYIAYASSDSTVGMFSLRMLCAVRPGLFHTSSVNSCSFQEDSSGFWTAVSHVRKSTDTFLVKSRYYRVPIEWSASSSLKLAPVS